MKWLLSKYLQVLGVCTSSQITTNNFQNTGIIFRHVFHPLLFLRLIFRFLGIKCQHVFRVRTPCLSPQRDAFFNQIHAWHRLLKDTPKQFECQSNFFSTKVEYSRDNSSSKTVLEYQSSDQCKLAETGGYFQLGLRGVYYFVFYMKHNVNCNL